MSTFPRVPSTPTGVVTTGEPQGILRPRPSGTQYARAVTTKTTSFDGITDNPLARLLRPLFTVDHQQEAMGFARALVDGDLKPLLSPQPPTPKDTSHPPVGVALTTYSTLMFLSGFGNQVVDPRHLDAAVDRAGTKDPPALLQAGLKAFANLPAEHDLPRCLLLLSDALKIPDANARRAAVGKILSDNPNLETHLQALRDSTSPVVNEKGELLTLEKTTSDKRSSKKLTPPPAVADMSGVLEVLRIANKVAGLVSRPNLFKEEGSSEDFARRWLEYRRSDKPLTSEDKEKRGVALQTLIAHGVPEEVADRVLSGRDDATRILKGKKGFAEKFSAEELLVLEKAATELMAKEQSGTPLTRSELSALNAALWAQRNAVSTTERSSSEASLSGGHAVSPQLARALNHFVLDPRIDKWDPDGRLGMAAMLGRLIEVNGFAVQSLPELLQAVWRIGFAAHQKHEESKSTSMTKTGHRDAVFEEPLLLYWSVADVGSGEVRESRSPIATGATKSWEDGLWMMLNPGWLTGNAEERAKLGDRLRQPTKSEVEVASIIRDSAAVITPVPATIDKKVVGPDNPSMNRKDVGALRLFYAKEREVLVADFVAGGAAAKKPAEELLQAWHRFDKWGREKQPTTLWGAFGLTPEQGAFLWQAREAARFGGKPPEPEPPGLADAVKKAAATCPSILGAMKSGSALPVATSVANAILWWHARSSTAPAS